MLGMSPGAMCTTNLSCGCLGSTEVPRLYIVLLPAHELDKTLPYYHGIRQDLKSTNLKGSQGRDYHGIRQALKSTNLKGVSGPVASIARMSPETLSSLSMSPFPPVMSVRTYPGCRRTTFALP